MLVASAQAPRRALPLVRHPRRDVGRVVAPEHARHAITDQQRHVEQRRDESDPDLDPALKCRVWCGAPHGRDPTLTPVNWGACPACGGPLEPWRQVPSAEPAVKRTFELLRCIRCGSATTVGEPSDELHDSGAYSAGPPRLHALALPLLNAFDSQRLGILRRLIEPPASVLDVGAGRGRFVANARRAGYDARGIEPSKRGAHAAAAIGAPVAKTTLDQADLEPSSLDAATVWHVLEHLDQPRLALGVLARALKPGGALLIGIPNLASVQARIGGARW